MFEAIRRDHELRGWGIRRLARGHRVGRATVRQALMSAVPQERKAPVRESLVLGPAKPFIEKVLEEDLKAPRKQRHTAHRIWERLGEELGIEIAESTVGRYVGRRKREEFGAAEVMVPQTKTPGAESEVGFFESTGIKLVLAVHDELVLEVPEARAEDTAELLRHCIIEAAEAFLHSVPVEVEVQVCRTWAGGAP